MCDNFIFSFPMVFLHFVMLWSPYPFWDRHTNVKTGWMWPKCPICQCCCQFSEWRWSQLPDNQCKLKQNRWKPKQTYEHHRKSINIKTRCHRGPQAGQPRATPSPIWRILVCKICKKQLHSLLHLTNHPIVKFWSSAAESAACKCAALYTHTCA